MAIDPIQELASLFLRFPGIGRRQAKRFVYHLLESGPKETEQLITTIKNLSAQVKTCESCHRFFLTNDNTVCSLCTAPARDSAILMVVEKDADLDNIEKLGAYHGRYFVLGGLTSFIPEEETPLRLKELATKIKNTPVIKEVVLALSVNAEGDQTINLLEDTLRPLQTTGLKITHLARGLSHGSELEYIDPETLKNALEHRV
ncbi:MAG: toprim domain-containing protein [bacterium]|nr:toprim domain-containing protein [bacterium]